MTDEKIIVCVRATNPVVSKGSVFTHLCSKCGERVAISPSGDKLLKSDKEIAVVCCECLDLPKDKPVEIQFGAGTPEQTAKEISEVIPNDWLKRN